MPNDTNGKINPYTEYRRLATEACVATKAFVRHWTDQAKAANRGDFHQKTADLVAARIIYEVAKLNVRIEVEEVDKENAEIDQVAIDVLGPDAIKEHVLEQMQEFPLEFFCKYRHLFAPADEGVYVMYSVFDEEESLARYSLTRDAYYKIGFSDAVRSRRSTFECGNPFELKICHVVETDDLKWCEDFFHKRFRYKRTNREWHKLSAKELALLMSIPVLNRPKTIAEQRAVLELQSQFERIADDGSEMYR